MGRQLSIDVFAKAALSAIEKAHKDYMVWSGGIGLWSAPEYLSTVYISRELAKNQTKSIVKLEYSPALAMKAAGAKGRGRYHKEIRANGRFDILLCWSDGSPRAPIEVKGNIRSIKTLERDLIRIKKVLNRNKYSSFQFGMVVFNSSKLDPEALSNERLERWEKDIISGVNNIVGNDCIINLLRSNIMIDDDGAFVAMSIVLRPRNDN